MGAPTPEIGSEWWSNPAASTVRRQSSGSRSRSFHKSAPGYERTPLVDLPALAMELGVGRVFVKDESSRLGLPAFKVLGASWAVANVVARRVGLEGPITWANLEDAAAAESFTLVTATDGNHGRAVAWMARMLELNAHVVVPSVISDSARGAIAGEGAVVEKVDGDYDMAVSRAADLALSLPDAELVQDMGWDGYEEVPAWIVAGYGTMFSEVDQQLAALGLDQASVIVVPVGVGSLAEAVVNHYRSTENSSLTAVLGVEPVTAACLMGSLKAGQLTTVPTSPTVMAGLYCATPSAAAWPVLREGMDAAVTVDDGSALQAVEDLSELGVSSGPSGASSLAGARAALSGGDIGGVSVAQRRELMGVVHDSVVVLLSTEARHEAW